MVSSPNATLFFLFLTIISLLIHADTSFTQKMSNGATAAALSLPPYGDDSGSIEMPVRRQQRSGLSQHRPIVDLVLGVLDTFHSSSKSELRRIQSRHARHQDQAQYYELVTSTNIATPAQPTGTAKTAKAVPTTRKRLITAKYTTEAKNSSTIKREKDWDESRYSIYFYIFLFFIW